MNPKEVRIGNIVHCEIHNQDVEDRELSLRDFATYLDTDPDYYSPIPLNEEWLIKLGFDNYHGWYLRDCPVWLDKDFIPQVTVAVGWENGTIEIAKTIQFVHTLQNFYYILGEELTLIKSENNP